VQELVSCNIVTLIKLCAFVDSSFNNHIRYLSSYNTYFKIHFNNILLMHVYVSRVISMKSLNLSKGSNPVGPITQLPVLSAVLDGC
jgi:hypothetical protein